MPPNLSIFCLVFLAVLSQCVPQKESRVERRSATAMVVYCALVVPLCIISYMVNRPISRDIGRLDEQAI